MILDARAASRKHVEDAGRPCNQTEGSTAPTSRCARGSLHSAARGAMPKRQDASSGGGGTINPLMAGPLPGSSRGGTADKLVDHRDRGDGACCSHVTGCHDGPAALLSRSLRAGRWMAPADLIRCVCGAPFSGARGCAVCAVVGRGCGSLCCHGHVVPCLGAPGIVSSPRGYTTSLQASRCC